MLSIDVDLVNLIKTDVGFSSTGSLLWKTTEAVELNHAIGHQEVLQTNTKTALNVAVFSEELANTIQPYPSLSQY